MKVSTSDLLAILRQFGEAGETDVPRLIDQVNQSHPSPINQLVRFRFKRHQYYVLFDETAEDRVSYIIQQIETVKSELSGELLINPKSHVETHGLPFKGKDAYIYRAQSAKQRIDTVLTERYPDINRNTWQKYLKAGYISVNGQVVTKSSHEIISTDELTIEIPAGTDHSASELPILYIDDDVIVINKPVGVLTHSKGAMNDEFTVADFFRRYTTVGLETNRPGIVHRLDRDTSGVMIGARTPEAFEILKHQFADRLAHKRYLAITAGIPSHTEARIDVPIARHPSAPSTFRPDTKGKSAVTDYQVLETSGTTALLALSPKTGRTHQLRVHLQHLGTPILGDRVYGKSAERLYLHAYTLEITIGHAERRTFIAPIPDEFLARFPGAVQDAAHL